MKIDELNQPKKVNEGALLDILIGPEAAKRFSKDDDRHREALTYFLKDFVGDAMTSLENGVQGGFVDPTKTSDEKINTNPAPAKPAPAPGPTSAEKTVAAARGFRKDTTAAATTMAAARAAQKKPGHLRTADDKIAMRAAGLSESEYDSLNIVFESIMSTMFEDDGSAESISDYLTTWFDAYMQGVDWRSKENLVIPRIKEVEKTYNVDKGRTALQNLGRIAWNILGPAPTVPAGAKDIPSREPTPGQTAPKQSAKKADQILGDIANLKTSNPREFNKLKQVLNEL